MAFADIHPNPDSLKRCSRCGESKALDQFLKKTEAYSAYCRRCNKAYQAEWYARNREAVKARSIAWNRSNPEQKSQTNKIWRAQNAERVRENGKNWVAANYEKRREIWQKWYRNNRPQADAATKKWIAEHPHHVSERSRRLKATRKQCFVSWADRDAMAAIYAEASRLTAETGIPHEVDHIVPLTSKIVCGLHWEGNLRVVTRAENRSKQNKLIEDLV